MREIVSPLDGFASPFGQRLREGGAAFDPVSLFASGEEGALLLTGPTTCFTDTAGTTAAGAGDSVARINDTSGNANHATQTNPDNRPVLQQTAGGLWYLDFDGVDDWIATAIGTPLGAGMTAYSAFAAFELNAESNTDGILSFTDDFFFTGDSLYLLRNRSNTGIDQISGFPFGTNDFFPAAQSSSTLTPYISGMVSESGGQSARLNGTEYATGTVTQSASTPAEIILGDYPKSGGGAGNLKIFSALVINRTLTTQEISDTETFLADRSGVTL